MRQKKAVYLEMKSMAEAMKSVMRQLKVMYWEKSLVEAKRYVPWEMKALYSVAEEMKYMMWEVRTVYWMM